MKGVVVSKERIKTNIGVGLLLGMLGAVVILGGNLPVLQTVITCVAMLISGNVAVGLMGDNQTYLNDPIRFLIGLGMVLGSLIFPSLLLSFVLEARNYPNTLYLGHALSQAAIFTISLLFGHLLGIAIMAVMCLFGWLWGDSFNLDNREKNGITGGILRTFRWLRRIPKALSSHFFLA